MLQFRSCVSRFVIISYINVFECSLFTILYTNERVMYIDTCKEPRIGSFRCYLEFIVQRTNCGKPFRKGVTLLRSNIFC